MTTSELRTILFRVADNSPVSLINSKGGTTVQCAYVLRRPQLATPIGGTDTPDVTFDECLLLSSAQHDTLAAYFG